MSDSNHELKKEKKKKKRKKHLDVLILNVELN